MKKILCLSLFSSFYVYANNDRCIIPSDLAPQGYIPWDMYESYKTLTWSLSCKKLPADKIRLANFHLMVADENTKNGTYFPPAGTAEYESLRNGVNGPVWFRPAPSLSFWFDPMARMSQSDKNIAGRIYNQDCSVNPPAIYTDVIFCTAGCYSGTQNLLFYSNDQMAWKQIKEAHNKETHIVTLSKDSTFDKITFDVAKVDYFIKDRAAAEQMFFTFYLASGRTLEVTPTHPILDENGLIREAQDFSTKNSFISMDGSRDPVVKIVKNMKKEEAFNVEPTFTHDKNRIVIANGYLNGSHWHQTHGKKTLKNIEDRMNQSTRLAAFLDK